MAALDGFTVYLFWPTLSCGNAENFSVSFTLGIPSTSFLGL